MENQCLETAQEWLQVLPALRRLLSDAAATPPGAAAVGKLITHLVFKPTLLLRLGAEQYDQALAKEVLEELERSTALHKNLSFTPPPKRRRAFHEAAL